LFNHESPRRGEIFVTKKVTMAIANIIAGNQKRITLGALDAKRDWGFAPEYVEIMWTMLQQQKADDYIVGTGETHTVQEFVDVAFDYVGLSSSEYVDFVENKFRSRGAKVLRDGSVKAYKKLGWKPKIKFGELVKIMVDADVRAAGLEPIGEGDQIIQDVFTPKWWTND
jgi:GDPmannose 4,6-dehydratase